ncbi:hypothetical protein ONZ45_g12820 [Pleurotus djamor]|nr:hypothetical protein ONZ45_g12820 [Pleurotus djamor]
MLTTSPDNARSPTPPRRRRAEVDVDSSAECAPAIGSTCKKRRKYESTVASGVKRAAQLALISAMLDHDHEYPYQYHYICGDSRVGDEMSPIQFSHTIAKSVDDLTLTKLEWAWNMDYYTLNLDSSKNLQPLTTPLHSFLDKGTDSWFWLPADPNLMDRLYAIYIVSPASPPRRTLKAEYKKKKTFDYDLIALKGMEYAWDIQQYLDSYTSKSVAIRQSPMHGYPFDELPTYRLHLYPHLVIFNAGQKLDRFFPDNPSPSVEEFIAKFPFLNIFQSRAFLMQQCLALYRFWMSLSPPPSFTASRDSKVPPIPGQPRPSRTGPTQNTRNTDSNGAASVSACSRDSYVSSSAEEDSTVTELAELEELSHRVTTWAENVYQAFLLDDDEPTTLADATAPGADHEPRSGSDGSSSNGSTPSSSEPDDNLPLSPISAVCPRVESNKTLPDDIPMIGQVPEKE